MRNKVVLIHTIQDEYFAGKIVTYNHVESMDYNGKSPFIYLSEAWSFDMWEKDLHNLQFLEDWEKDDHKIYLGELYLNKNQIAWIKEIDEGLWQLNLQKGHDA